ncbi:hypothetical protein GGI07_000840 [Coemansia sp. Benny D115]|nr:hypothetical protein GGI07_000840 [Coemansia sp. Benny D115]
MASRRSDRRAVARPPSSRSKPTTSSSNSGNGDANSGSAETDASHRPLPASPRGYQTQPEATSASHAGGDPSFPHSRHQLMSLFGTYQAGPALESENPAGASDDAGKLKTQGGGMDIATDGSSGSLASHHHVTDFASPSPPSSANVSTTSSGHLPENVHLSMPGMSRPVAQVQPQKSFSADQSRAELRSQKQQRKQQHQHQQHKQQQQQNTQPAPALSPAARNEATGGPVQPATPAEQLARLMQIEPGQLAGLSEHQRKKIIAAYNNQYAHLLGNPMQQVTPSGNGVSPAISLISSASFSSPLTITLEDLQRASRMQPRRTAAPSRLSSASQDVDSEIDDDDNVGAAYQSVGSVGSMPSEHTPSTGTGAGSSSAAQHPLHQSVASLARWSEATTPSPRKERDSGLFGGQPFSFTSPANPLSGAETPGIPGGFEPIQELDEESSWSQSVARRQGVTPLAIERQRIPQFAHDNSNDAIDDSASDTPDDPEFSDRRTGTSTRPRYDVVVPPPETLVRTPVLARSPTPTSMLESRTVAQPQRTPSRLSTTSESTTQGRRRRATTVSMGADSVTHGGDTRSRRDSNTNSNTDTSYSRHSRSRSFGSSTEHITLQQLQAQRQRLQQLQAEELRQLQMLRRQRPDIDDLAIPLIPPPPADEAQRFQSPFIDMGPARNDGDNDAAATTGSLPSYLYDGPAAPAYSRPDSVTHTRIRHRKQRNPSSVVSSAASPAYTLSSAYSPSVAGSNVTYEMTFLGLHRTAESAYQPSVSSRANTSQVASEASVGGLRRGQDPRRRSASMASDRRRPSDALSAAASDLSSSPVPMTSAEIRSARRRQMHTRSESVGSSRVSSIREEFEQRQAAATAAAAAQDVTDDTWAGPRPTSAMSSHRSDSGRPTTPGRKATPVLERWENARREAAGTSRSGHASPGPGPSSASALAAMRQPLTPKSRKVAQMRERIEEWQQRTEAADSPLGSTPSPLTTGGALHKRGDSSSMRGSAPSAATASTAQGAQHQIGEIESVSESTDKGKSAEPAGKNTGAQSSYRNQKQQDRDRDRDRDQAQSQPRLVPLTPALGHGALRHAHTQVDRVQALARSNTQVSHDSKYSLDTTQSSNIPPSLFGSDKSVFSTPLLSKLPPVSVPSDISSLRTADTAPRVHRPPIPAQRTAAEPTRDSAGDRDSKLLGSVLSAVASPVSVGGHKKQPLVVDARTASTEILQGLQEVRSATPSIHYTSISTTPSSSHVSGGGSSSSVIAEAPRTKTKAVLESPAVAAPSMVPAKERRTWAVHRPTDRPPLLGLSDDSMSSGESRLIDEKIRRRADTGDSNETADNAIRFPPQIADSPAHALDSKSSGGLIAGGILAGSSTPTPPVSEEFRKERVFSTLASLEGGNRPRPQKSPRSRKTRQNRASLGTGPSSPNVPHHDPTGDNGNEPAQHQLANMQSRFSFTNSSKRTTMTSEDSGIGQVNSSSPSFDGTPSPSSTPHSKSSSDRQHNTREQQNAHPTTHMYEEQLLTEIATPVANIARPPSQRMGRHGSSPLNPYTGSPAPTTASGSVAPPLPPLPPVANPAVNNNSDGSSAVPQVQPGLLQRITGTIRRKRPADRPKSQYQQYPEQQQQQQQQQQQPMQVAPVARTPLPRRWWRNIKESMYAPIPPLHGTQQLPVAASSGLAPLEPAMVEQLPGRPVRRHSFSGSTDIEQGRITAALSPRENIRRKISLADRVRGMLRGRRSGLVANDGAYIPAQSGAAALTVATMANPDDALSLKLAHTVSQAASAHPQSPAAWAPTNPFSQSIVSPALGPTGVRRRASFDTLSIHQMAQLDHSAMQSRLNNLLGSNAAVGTAAAAVGAAGVAGAMAAANQPVSSKFSFTAPTPAHGGIPQTPVAGAKPLPATPRQKSQQQMMEVPKETPVFSFPPKQEMVQRQSGEIKSPSPMFKDSSPQNIDSKQQPVQSIGHRLSDQHVPMQQVQTGSGSQGYGSKQEMVQRPPVASNVHFGHGSNDIMVNAAQVSSPAVLPPVTTGRITDQPGNFQGQPGGFQGQPGGFQSQPYYESQPQQQQQILEQPGYQSAPQPPVSSQIPPQENQGLYKRPSLLSRLTSGWRKPVPMAPPQGSQLHPIAEEGAAAHGQSGHGGLTNTVKTAAGVAAAAGLLGRLFQPAASGVPKDESQAQSQAQNQGAGLGPMQGQQGLNQGPMQGQVPAVSIVMSPVANQSYYGGPTGGPMPQPNTGAYGSSGPGQFQGPPGPPGLPPNPQQQQNSSGGTMPQSTMMGMPAVLSPTAIQRPTQTPMPGQQFQTMQSGYPQQPDPAYAQQYQQANNYSGDSYYPGTQGHIAGNSGGPPGAAMYAAGPHGAVSTPNTPVAPIPSAPSGASKLMSMLSALPLVGGLFGKKKQEPSPQPPQAGGFSTAPNASHVMPPSRYDYHGQSGAPGQALSFTTSYEGHFSQHPGNKYNSGPTHNDSGPAGTGAGNLFSKLIGMVSGYQIPILTFALRESVRRNSRALVGRYALQYPLVEAEENAAIKAANAEVKKSNIVKAGALRAIDAKEFRHAAPGLRYESLDQLLENTHVPRFSRLRKYRRAPEVWDDEDALNIVRRVRSRMRTVQESRGREQARVTRVLSNASGARRPGEPVLRGGGGRGHGRVTKNRYRVADLERGESMRYVDGHPGSGERAMGDAEYTLRGGGNMFSSGGIGTGAGSYGGDGVSGGEQLFAHRIGAFFAKKLGGSGGAGSGSRRPEDLRQQSSASFLSSPTRRGLRHQQASRVSPGTEGLSRIIDSEDDTDYVHVAVSIYDSDKPKKDDESKAGSIHGSDLISLRREPTIEGQQDQTQRDIVLDDADRDDDDEEDEPRPANSNGRAGLRQRLFGAWRTQRSGAPAASAGTAAATAAAEIEPAEQAPPPEPVPANSGPANATTQTDPKKSPHYPPMFPPFSHLPLRMVDQIMHRVGEPRVFIGSAGEQLVPPNNETAKETGDIGFVDAGPYRTGTEWNFAESVKFSLPYPTAATQVNNKSVWARINGGGADVPGKTTKTRRLLVKPRSSEISRWPLHLEIIRDYIQLLALVLGSCGFVKSPLDSTVGQRWPWMILAGIPDTLGFLWADLSTTTGKSIGFFVFFGAITLGALAMWSYGLYIEGPTPVPRPSGVIATAEEAKNEKAKSEAGGNVDGDGATITYEEELTVVPSPFNIFGRLFGSIPKRDRMHIAYFVLSTMYIPMIKLCLEALTWSQGYWAIPNPFRLEDRPVFPKPEDGEHRDPSKFCYTTTMRNGHFNGAFVVIPLAVILFFALGLVLPVQVYTLSKRHMPRVPGWRDGKTPGHKLPPAGNGPPSRPMSALAAAAAPPINDAATARNIRAVSPAARSTSGYNRPRDDVNPMLSANALLQGIDKLGIMNPEVFGNLAMLYNLANGGSVTGNPNEAIGGMLTGIWGNMQKWFTSPGKASSSIEDDPYLGMERDEAYQARLRDMKMSDRNRHLATVQYRRALDGDTADYRFLYVPHYPAHAADPARLLLWKLVAVIVAVVLAKDNCWLKSRSRHSLDAGRNAALLIVALLMLRSHHSHRPYFDPTANTAALLMRIGVLLAVAFAFPLFLMSNPLSSTHMGLCITLAIINLLVLLALIWFLSSTLPRFQMVVRGTSQPLTLSPGILVATNPYDPRLRRLLIERVWQDTWSAILLASRDFRLLPNHRIAFCKTRAHPPYMVNYIGFAAERHLENLHLYDAIGRQAYCKAVEIERYNEQRAGLMNEIAREFTGPDMYFNPYANAGNSSGALTNNFYGVGRSEVRTWFGKTYILHFPFMVCMVYDELPGVVVPISDQEYLRLYLEQNRNDPAVVARRDLRRRLRALDGQFVTLTYIENAGPNGSHQRYCLPEYAQDNDAYLAQYTGRRRILYRGQVNIHQHADVGAAMTTTGVSVGPGFDCRLTLTDEITVDDENLVNNLSRAHNAFRLAFWRTGHAPESIMLVRSNITARSRKMLNINEYNRHLMGVTTNFDPTPELRAFLEENSETIDERLAATNAALAQHASEIHTGFLRKRTGLTPAFHIDVFAPGPESHHVKQMERQAAEAPGSARPFIPATPTPFGANAVLSGQWQNDEHGRLSYIPTMEQLAERLERYEENRYMRDLLVDHRDDITLLYERLRTLVPSNSNNPVKFAWYIFWDDIYRRYGKPTREGGIKQLREYDVDFNPLYPQALPYYPLSRPRLERFLYERGLWKPLRKPNSAAAHMLDRNGNPLSGNGGGGFLGGGWLPWGGNNRKRVAAGAEEEFGMEPMPVPNYIPGVTRPSQGGMGNLNGMATEARIWRAGDDTENPNDALFPPGTPASGFIHSGLLNRLYAWLDMIAYGPSR